jgi:hypothetical protein
VRSTRRWTLGLAPAVSRVVLATCDLDLARKGLVPGRPEWDGFLRKEVRGKWGEGSDQEPARRGLTSTAVSYPGSCPSRKPVLDAQEPITTPAVCAVRATRNGHPDARTGPRGRRSSRLGRVATQGPMAAPSGRSRRRTLGLPLPSPSTQPGLPPPSVSAQASGDPRSSLPGEQSRFVATKSAPSWYTLAHDDRRRAIVLTTSEGIWHGWHGG